MDYFQRYVKACLDSLAKAGRYIWEVGQPCQDRNVQWEGGATSLRWECTCGLGGATSLRWECTFGLGGTTSLRVLYFQRKVKVGVT